MSTDGLPTTGRWGDNWGPESKPVICQSFWVHYRNRIHEDQYPGKGRNLYTGNQTGHGTGLSGYVGDALLGDYLKLAVVNHATVEVFTNDVGEKPRGSAL